MIFIIMKNLTTSPVVKVVNIHIDAEASIAEMESKIDSRLRVSMLQSKEMNSTAQY